MQSTGKPGPVMLRPHAVRLLAALAVASLSAPEQAGSTIPPPTLAAAAGDGTSDMFMRVRRQNMCAAHLAELCERPESPFAGARCTAADIAAFCGVQVLADEDELPDSTPPGPHEQGQADGGDRRPPEPPEPPEGGSGEQDGGDRGRHLQEPGGELQINL